jgi:hypothetical protein
MMGLSEFLGKTKKIKKNSKKIIKATAEMFRSHEEGTFTGRGNTKEDIQTRISSFKDMIAKAIE